MNENDITVTLTESQHELLNEILPQLDSLAATLFDIYQSAEGRRLDKIIDELTAILNQEND